MDWERSDTGGFGMSTALLMAMLLFSEVALWERTIGNDGLLEDTRQSSVMIMALGWAGSRTILSNELALDQLLMTEIVIGSQAQIMVCSSLAAYVVAQGN